jgi:hypothetical protein
VGTRRVRDALGNFSGIDELPPELSDLSPEDARLRALLWSIVNFAIPLRVGLPDGTEEQEMLARANWLLPRTPVVGEYIQVLGKHVPVERVLWTDERKVLVRLAEMLASGPTLEALEAAGWEILGPESEPPSEWFEQPG